MWLPLFAPAFVINIILPFFWNRQTPSKGVKTLMGPDQPTAAVGCGGGISVADKFPTGPIPGTGRTQAPSHPPGSHLPPSPCHSPRVTCPPAALPTALSPADLPALVMIISVPASWNFFHSSFSCSPTLMFSMVWGWEGGELVGLAGPQLGSTRSLHRVERRPTKRAEHASLRAHSSRFRSTKIILNRWRIGNFESDSNSLLWGFTY